VSSEMKMSSSRVEKSREASERRVSQDMQDVT
jgi:hypothetical protein